MGKQRGGSFKNSSGTIHTAETILDKFRDIYFAKNDITFPEDSYALLNKYTRGNDCKANKSYEWFKTESGLIPDDLSYESIERNVYTTLVSEEGHYTFLSPSYVFVKTGSPDRAAYHPVVKRENGKWKLYVDSGATRTEIESNQQKAEDAIIEIIVTNAKYPVFPGTLLRTATFMSGIKAPNEKLSFPAIKNGGVSNFNPEAYGFNHPKLIFKLTKDGNDDVYLQVFYAEKINDDEWKFHPHNMLNFIPKEEDIQQFKLIFQAIKAKMEELHEGSSYNLVPDKFYHFHVSSVSGKKNIEGTSEEVDEDSIIITIHGLYENFKSRVLSALNSYTYKSPGNTNAIRLTREGEPGGGSIWNRENEYQEYSKRHNAYILVKSNGTNSIYSLNTLEQKGNPFFMASDDPNYVHFGLNEAAFGKVKYDVNHIKGKGVLLTPTSSSCSAFCDDNCIREKDGPNKIKKFYIDSIHETAETINRNWASANVPVAATGNNFNWSAWTGGKRKHTRKRRASKKARKSRKGSR